MKTSCFIFGLWLYDFWFQDTNDFKSPLTVCRWIKNLSAKTTKYTPKHWDRYANRDSNLNFIRVIKHSSFDQNFQYNIFNMVFFNINFLKILCWQFLVPRSERLLISSATLSCKTNMSTFSMLVYFNTNGFFLRSFSRMQ